MLTNNCDDGCCSKKLFMKLKPCMEDTVVIKNYLYGFWTTGFELYVNKYNLAVTYASQLNTVIYARWTNCTEKSQNLFFHDEKVTHCTSPVLAIMVINS